MNSLEITKSAVETFGVAHQLDMAVEELAELIQAINKIKRKFKLEDLAKIKDGTFIFSTTKETLVYNHICGEVADVKIMIEQLEHILKTDNIDICRERKITRLAVTIDKYKKKHSVK